MIHCWTTSWNLPRGIKQGPQPTTCAANRRPHPISSILISDPYTQPLEPILFPKFRDSNQWMNEWQSLISLSLIFLLLLYLRDLLSQGRDYILSKRKKERKCFKFFFSFLAHHHLVVERSPILSEEEFEGASMRMIHCNIQLIFTIPRNSLPSHMICFPFMFGTVWLLGLSRNSMVLLSFLMIVVSYQPEEVN